MKKILLINLLLASSLFARTQIIDNLTTTKHIRVSRSDVNRLVFPYKITYQANSKEKDLTISVVGNEMFVKFMPVKIQSQETVKNKVVSSGKVKIDYSKSNPAELFIVTKKKTYSIVLHPKRGEATTVMFTESFDKKKKKLFVNKDAEYVDNIANNIIKPILLESKLRGYEKKNVKGLKHTIKLDKMLFYKLKTTYSGLRYKIYEYIITNPNKTPYTINNSKKILHDIVEKIDKKISAYTIFYGNRVYKMLPNKSAKLLIVTTVE